MSLLKIIEQKKKEKELAKKKKNAKNLAISAAIGVATGAVSGILLAPKSGKETRDDIKRTSSDINHTVKEKVSTAKGNLKEKSTEAHSKIKDYLNSKKGLNSIDEDIEESVDEVFSPEDVEEDDNDSILDNSCEETEE